MKSHAISEPPQGSWSSDRESRTKMGKRLGAMSEEEMARGVVTEMQRQGWDVYQEVVASGRRADIVGVRGPLTMVVECKTALSLKLLDQVMCWRGYANYVVAAYGGGRAGRATTVLCKETGVGLWSVYHSELSEAIPPRFQRRTWDGLKDALRPEQRSAQFAQAGSQGGYFTPFRGTCNALYKVVKQTPGITLRDALKEVKHHYASHVSAMSSLPGLIRKGIVAGVRITDGDPLRLYLDGDLTKSYGVPEIAAKTPLLEATVTVDGANLDQAATILGRPEKSA